MTHKCADCINLSPRDVFNGYCEAKEQSVLIDDAACPSFQSTQKCKFCKKYEASEKEFLGICNGEMVYPDLGGCEQFTAK
ncbi:MAG: hypothetical protein CXZ00_05115 [Acidobacteria bacterium]|nr:MAG: hypothetical protein CXZ00_05115 [Acidobacteriota bacterium]